MDKSFSEFLEHDKSFSEHDKSFSEKIFISIASYRDPELINTVDNILSSANRPDLLRIVVYEQNDPSDISIKNIFPNVLVISSHYSLAKGPYYARAIIQEKYSGEEYYLQIDSHTRLIKDWDTHLKKLLNLLPEPAILTQYPPEYSLVDNTYDINIVRSGLYVKGFGPDGFTRIQSNIAKYKHNYPYTSKAWSACFSFSKGSIVHDAPYDKSLEYLFFGEELDITLRLYTRGYYFFSPHYTIVFTMFKRNYRRTYWQDIPSSKRSHNELKSRKKLHNRIINQETGKYGFGTLRTIKEYEKFAGIESLINGKMKKLKNKLL